MNKREKIQLIYSIVIGVFVVALGIALICVAGDIYYSNRDTGEIYTSEIVSQHLKAFIAPFVILIVAIAAGVIFPLYEVRAKVTAEHTAKLLEKKLPSVGEGEEYAAALAQYNKLSKLRIVLYSVTGALLLACTIATLVYMLNAEHFANNGATSEILAMVKNVLPWIVSAFVVLIVATILSNIIAKKRVQAIKTLIKYGNGETATAQELQFIAMARKYLQSDITLWVVRGIIFVVGVTFLILGIVNGGARDVLVKAINICRECIGLG